MSSFYTLEPQTTAKVLMHTTAGDLEIELWATQCPLTCRNFLQLCLDGYYNNTIFHRLVPGFILQGGDPTGTGHGGEAIYPGGLFADEFHSRLKYNRRGLLGMANSGKKDDNGSQFFFTLGDTKELTGKNTLFGKIVGDTIYNLVKMGEMELEEEGSEKMLYPVKITGTEVLVNPFDDIKPREDEKKKKELAEKEKQAEAAKKPGKKKVAGKKGKALLSFGGEEEEDGDGAPSLPVKKKPKFDTRLVTAAPESEGMNSKSTTDEASKARALPPPVRRRSPSQSSESEPESRPLPPPPTRRAPIPIPSRSPTPPPQTDSKLEKANAEIAALKAQLRRRSPTPPPITTPKKHTSLLALQKSMLPTTSVKGRKRKRNGKGKGNAEDADDDAMDALERFRRKLAAAEEAAASEPAVETPPVAPAEALTASEPVTPADDEEAQLCDLHFIPNCLSCQSWEAAHAKKPSDEDGDEDNDEGAADDFLGHKLVFEKDRLGKDLNWKKDHEYDDGLVVIDPREKGREIVESKRGRGGGRSGAFSRGAGGRRDNDRDRDRGASSAGGRGGADAGGSWRGR